MENYPKKLFCKFQFYNQADSTYLPLRMIDVSYVKCFLLRNCVGLFLTDDLSGHVRIPDYLRNWTRFDSIWLNTWFQLCVTSIAGIMKSWKKTLPLSFCTKVKLKNFELFLGANAHRSNNWLLTLRGAFHLFYFCLSHAGAFKACFPFGG